MQLDKTEIVVRERQFWEVVDLALPMLRANLLPIAWTMALGAIPCGIVNQLQAVVVEQRVQRLGGGNVFPADGNRGLRRGLAVRSGLAEGNFRIKHVVQVGLAREILDGVSQRHVVHHNQRNQSRVAPAAGPRCSPRRETGRRALRASAE